MPIMDGLEATQKIYQVATSEKKITRNCSHDCQ